ncbi:Alpha/Beta hydrolase protein [Aspergillus floccosus]
MSVNDRLAGFDLLQSPYKTVGDHEIRADFIIPQSDYTGKRPVIVRFHGGGLVTGDSLFLEWFPLWLFDMARKYNAVIVSPNYRLMPEATSLEIYEDVEDFWVWLHSPVVAQLLANTPQQTELDLSRILTAGESAGGLLSIYLGLAHPEAIRATTAAYPCVDMASTHFSTPAPAPLTDPPLPASFVADFLAQVQPGSVRSSAIPPERLDLMIAAIHYGDLLALYERGTEHSPQRAVRFPLEKLEQPGARLPRGGIAILHGVLNMVVPKEGSEKFIRKAGDMMRGTPGGDRLVLTLREGEHGFDNDTPLEEPWLQDHLRQAIEAWLE